MQNLIGVLALSAAAVIMYCIGYNTGRRTGYEEGKRAGMFRARQSMMSQK
jgi:hypothetical protein